MRVHGDKIIKRRSEIKKKSDYHDYLPELREDFLVLLDYFIQLAETVSMGHICRRSPCH